MVFTPHDLLVKDGCSGLMMGTKRGQAKDYDCLCRDFPGNGQCTTLLRPVAQCSAFTLCRSADLLPSEQMTKMSSLS